MEAFVSSVWRKGAVVAYFEDGEQLAVEFYAAGETLLAAVLDDTLCVVIGERHVVVVFLVSSHNGQGVILDDCGTGDFLDPVGAFSEAEGILVNGL